MTAQKRDFNIFSLDFNVSNTLFSDFSQSPNEADITDDSLWSLHPDYDDFITTNFNFTEAPQKEHCFGQNEYQFSYDLGGLQNAEPKNICYGMIYLTKVKLIGSMENVMNELRSLEDVVKSHYLLDIIQSSKELFVALPSGLKAAQLNRQVSEALEDLVACDEVRLQALVHKETIINQILGASTSKQTESSININVYGSSSMLQTIGSCLTECKIWLQRPDWRPTGFTYDNPHVIRFATQSDSDTDLVSHPADAALDQVAGIHVDDIYSKLSRATHLKGVAGDSRLATKLLPHQEEALEFMLQREQGAIPDNFRLWIEETVNNVIQYRHKITGQRAMATPNEHGGGILADEMGTGKTLSALALIVATLEDANAWSIDQEVHLSENIPAFKTLSRATLVVAPSPLLLGTWQTELRKHMKTDLKVYTYHGTVRDNDCNFLANHDIVLTTYHTLVADHARNHDAITQIAWYRIVLDEAHFIRRTSTFLHKRVAELDAKSRWCLTGTPIQNGLDDLGSLLAFLRIGPFDRLGNFRRYISTKYAEGFTETVTAQRNLINLLDVLCIRRTKDQVKLCPVEERTRFVDFSREERIQYNSMREDMKRAMENITGESDSRRRFGAFQAKLQLRLLCNHGTFEDHFHWAKHGNLLDGYVEGVDGGVFDANTACNVCGSFDMMFFSEEDSMEVSSCVHNLCTTCKRKSSGQCPLCDYSLKTRDIASVRSERGSRTGKSLRCEGHSSKMEALVQDLLACREDKSIVFSCWTTTLELVAQYLHKYNIRFEQIDGRTPIASRQKILEDFSDDESMAVLIMTTGVGAFGLDLISANRVFLVEPQWNPSVESQAVGRTIRIGQQKTVQVTRYIMRGTMEEDFQELQRRKRGIARMAEKNGHESVVKAERCN